ncbi:hypothetical protein PCANC_09385 [Puccinia coronata f. sp. avenae]|uniref:Uncharacterized protein n=1 Tax=Puccinia coronata f. sp. avenae TaxID=200324 RepID=A0A2N5VDA2_9BASI|nr:hypothetical protein PCANC_09385 [Puccinia coronata f. sp. avenae]
MSVQRTPPHHPANTTTSRSAEDCPTESPKNTAIPNNRTPLHQRDHRVDGRQLPPRANSTNSGHYGNSSFVTAKKNPSGELVRHGIGRNCPMLCWTSLSNRFVQHGIGQFCPMPC